MLRIINPYPGFENGFYKPYTEAEANLFFGRSQDIAAIKLKLRQKKIVTLISDPKAGVTSLMRAGIIPNLRTQIFDGLNGKRWRCIYLHPGENPVLSLAQAIVNPYNKLSDKLKPSMEEDVYKRLLKNDYGLLRVLEQILGDQAFNILILIDDFIEVYARIVEEKMKMKFLRMIHKVLIEKNAPIYFTISLKKDDFRKEELKSFDKFYAFVTSGFFKIKFLNKDSLKKAIEMPAQFGQSQIEPELSTELIGELLHNPDQLRQLQLLMSRTWMEWKRKHKNRTVGKEHFYKATGQRAKAVSKSLSKGTTGKKKKRTSSLSGKGKSNMVELAKLDYSKLNDKEKQWFKILIPQLISIEEDGELLSTPKDHKQICKVLNLEMKDLGDFVTKIPTAVAMDERKISVNQIEVFEEWTDVVTWIKKEEQLKNRFKEIAEAAILHYIEGIDVKSVISKAQYVQIFEWYDPQLLTPAWAQHYHDNYELGLDFIEKLQQTYGKITPKKPRDPNSKISLKKPGQSKLKIGGNKDSDSGIKIGNSGGSKIKIGTSNVDEAAKNEALKILAGESETNANEIVEPISKESTVIKKSKKLSIKARPKKTIVKSEEKPEISKPVEQKPAKKKIVIKKK